MTTATAEKPTVEAPKARTMDASHRCDRCGAQAYASAQFVAEVLYFCGHHFTRFEEKITNSALSIVDERVFLIGKTSSVGEGFV